jgi:Sulfotransferase family
MRNRSGELYLCGGTQSSGSTLISWCFLQRHDMDGFLDADNDLLADIPRDWGSMSTWYKTTISCFRMSELMAHFQDAAWRVHPLLVVRDVRQVWASLCKKSYGLNGITAEDPPLRLRLRRFKEDWEQFRRNGWPMIRYETFVAEPVEVLRFVCSQLELHWDDAMLTWPKDSAEIASTKHGNQTFRQTRGQGLLQSLKQGPEDLKPGAIPRLDLEWLETEFAEFNQENGYPEHVHVAPQSDEDISRAIPNYESTRRHKWEMRRKPLRWFMHSIGFRGQAHQVPASR